MSPLKASTAHCSLLLLLLLLLGDGLGVVCFPANQKRDTTTLRLPTSVVPDHYDLTLQPDLKNASFQGNVTIYVTCMSATDVITLHQDRLTIDPSYVTISDVNNPVTSFSVVNVTEEKDFYFYRIHLSQHLTEGKRYSLQILNFQGQLRTDGKGLYLSSYKDGSEKILLASTQMEPTYARQVFPCFDEPVMKATFNVSLLRRTDTGRNYFTLSNMPRQSSYDLDSSWTVDVYQETMVMSTYLLAFAVCDFKYLSSVSSKYPVEIRTYVNPTRYQEGRLLHDYSVETFDWLNDHFRPTYDTYLPKLDNIVPPFFLAGAMENWGLVAYTNGLLYNSRSTQMFRLYMAYIPAHEIAHMWFGNKVSPKWWTWTWLNEGFADYWQRYIVEQLYPSVKSGYSEVSVMKMDSKNDSHPLNNPVTKHDAIKKQFDHITYAKGGAIVHMMHMMMGEHFIPGLNVYLNDHLLGNVDDQDLFNSLNKYIGTQADIDLDMKKIMDPWVNQRGYPLVNAHRQGDRLVLTQQHFQLGATSASDTEFKMFDIPITYTTSSERNFNKSRSTIVWMNADGSPLTINLTSQDTWVVLNLRHEAYYRVNYDVTTWKALIAQLNTDHTVFDQMNRATIIDDAFNLVKAELLPLEIALQTLDYLKKEVDFAPWQVFQSVTQYMESLIHKTELYAYYQRFIQGLVDEPIRKMGFDLPADNEPPIDVEKMKLIITDACQHEYAPCIQRASSMVTAWMNNSDSNMINVNLRATFYCTAVREGDHAVWNFIYQRFLNEKNARERHSLQTALGCSKDPAVLYAFLKTCLYKIAVLTSSCVSAVANNRYGRDVALNFVMENFVYLKKKFSSGTVGGMITAVTSHFHSKFHLAQLQFLRDSYVVSGLESTLDTVQQKTVVNMRWLDTNLDTIRRWLTSP